METDVFSEFSSSINSFLKQIAIKLSDPINITQIQLLTVLIGLISFLP
jgi:hypothetical protein